MHLNSTLPMLLPGNIFTREHNTDQTSCTSELNECDASIMYRISNRPVFSAQSNYILQICIENICPMEELSVNCQIECQGEYDKSQTASHQTKGILNDVGSRLLSLSNKHRS